MIIKYLLILVILIFLSSCIVHFPKRDVIVKGYYNSNPVIFFMSKGYLDEENKGKTWQYLDELEQIQEGREVNYE